MPHQPLWTTRMYVRLLGTHVRAALQYEADFWLMIAAAVLSQGVGLGFLAALFARVPHLDDWSIWHVTLMYAMVTVTEGIGSLLFEGTWRLSGMIHNGELEYLLVRPYPVALQVASSAVGFNGLGNILLGGVMIAVALPRAHLSWSLLTVSAAVLLFVSAAAVKQAISLATNSMSFWLRGPNPVVAYAAHQVGELARYPLGIYPTGLRVFMSVALPLAFTSYFPVAFVTGTTDNYLGLLTPLIAVYCTVAALFLFNRGLKRYESAGG
jgi:ABC-2 type transport system permease protein